MRIAITGGTGFLGSHLAVHLARAGVDVVLLARGVTESPLPVRCLPGITLLHGSVTDRTKVDAALAGCDAAVHLAGIVAEEGAQTFEAIHVRGTRNVAAAARELRVGKLVMATPSTFPAQSRLLMSKVAAEGEVTSGSSDYTILRSDVVYGEGDRLLTTIARAVRAGSLFPLPGYGRRAVSPVAVEDMVGVFAAAIWDPRLSRRAVRVWGPERVFASDVVRIVAAASGRRGWFVRMPSWLYRRRTLLEDVLWLTTDRSRSSEAPDAIGLPPDLRPRRRIGSMVAVHSRHEMAGTAVPGSRMRTA